MLWTDRPWRSAIVETDAAGLIAVHQAFAREGLVVLCVSANPAVPRAQVLAAAHEINERIEADSRLPSRSLFDIPRGDGHSWTIGERAREATEAGQQFETITDVALPAWEIRSELQLMDSSTFGATTATRVLHNLIGDGPSDSRQVALARFDRYGFEAAAVTGIATACAMVIKNERPVSSAPPVCASITRSRRSPSAVKHRATRPDSSACPVFEAWIHTPTEVPADDSA